MTLLLPQQFYLFSLPIFRGCQLRLHCIGARPRPLRARSRHLPPLALSVYGPLRDLQPRRRSIHPSPITSPRRRDCAISSGGSLGFVSRNLRLMKRVPPLTNFTLSKPTKANVPRSLAAMSKPPPLSIRIRILSFTFNFGPPPRRGGHRTVSG